MTYYVLDFALGRAVDPVRFADTVAPACYAHGVLDAWRSLFAPGTRGMHAVDHQLTGREAVARGRVSSLSAFSADVALLAHLWGTPAELPPHDLAVLVREACRRRGVLHDGERVVAIDLAADQVSRSPQTGAAVEEARARTSALAIQRLAESYDWCAEPSVSTSTYERYLFRDASEAAVFLREECGVTVTERPVDPAALVPPSHD